MDSPLVQPGVQEPLGQDQRILAEFDAYSWQTDLVFLNGLIALLGGVERLRPDPSHGDLAVHARIFYYQKLRNAQVDFAAYKQWTAGAGASQNDKVLAALYWARDQVSRLPGLPPDNVVDAVAAAAQNYVAPAPSPAWQQAAPKQPLRVTQTSAGGDSGSGAAPYPSHFAQVIAAVKNGQPVPGVREIPDTIVRDPAIKPVGKMAAPKKPWEINRAVAVEPHETPGSDAALVGQEFPPIDDEGAHQVENKP